LNLCDGDNGPLLRCHAGCSQDAVIRALRKRGLWRVPPSGHTAPRGNGRSPKGRGTRYEVRDVAGELVAIHVRRDEADGKKTFHWERPDGSKGLGGMPVSALPLYGSERLAALRDGDRIVLVEGEKAAEALTRRGVVAVGTVTGAASSPGREALGPLKRLSVVLWPDNDDPGRRHMARIGDALRRLGCADVRVVNPPEGSPKGWDAADFDGPDDELAALLGAGQPFEGEPEADGAAILNEVRSFIRRFVVTGDAELDALPLWVAHTHAVEVAEATAYMNITSAEKRSGKTRTLETLAPLVAAPWLTARTSPAVLVRKLDRDRPTLLLDETDAAFKDGGEYAETLRSVLNAGHRRGGVASLCVKAGSGFELRDFAVFGPKAFAGIGSLPETIRDRCIIIELRRRAPTEAVERFRRREAETLAAPIREALEHWAAAQLDALREARPDIPEALDDRAADGWEPLLAIADAAGGDWPERARRAAVILSAGESREDDSLGVRLLRDVRAVFEERGAERLASAEIVAALVGDEAAPWGDLRGKPLDARALARMLRRYGIKPHVMRLRDGTPRGYERADFEDNWARYLTPGEAQQAQQAQHSPDSDTRDVADVADVAVNPGIREQDNCAFCGAEVDGDGGFAPDGSPRCAGHYLGETDGPLVRAAVEEFGLRVVARRRTLCLACEDARESDFRRPAAGRTIRSPAP